MAFGVSGNRVYCCKCLQINCQRMTDALYTRTSYSVGRKQIGIHFCINSQPMTFKGCVQVQPCECALQGWNGTLWDDMPSSALPWSALSHAVSSFLRNTYTPAWRRDRASTDHNVCMIIWKFMQQHALSREHDFQPGMHQKPFVGLANPALPKLFKLLVSVICIWGGNYPEQGRHIYRREEKRARKGKEGRERMKRGEEWGERNKAPYWRFFFPLPALCAQVCWRCCGSMMHVGRTCIMQGVRHILVWHYRCRI